VKRRVVFVALVVLAVWPGVQHVVTDAYQMNHWRFAGWAMYTKPSPMPVLGIYSPDEQFELPLMQLTRMRGGREATSPSGASSGASSTTPTGWRQWFCATARASTR